jgi:hypothetical protein
MSIITIEAKADYNALLDVLLRFAVFAFALTHA